MVLWCRNCGALIGLRPPLEDWTVDRNVLCALCVDREYPGATKQIEQLIEKEQASSDVAT